MYLWARRREENVNAQRAAYVAVRPVIVLGDPLRLSRTGSPEICCRQTWTVNIEDEEIHGQLGRSRQERRQSVIASNSCRTCQNLQLHVQPHSEIARCRDLRRAHSTSTLQQAAPIGQPAAYRQRYRGSGMAGAFRQKRQRGMRVGNVAEATPPSSTERGSRTARHGSRAHSPASSRPRHKRTGESPRCVTSASWCVPEPELSLDGAAVAADKLCPCFWRVASFSADSKSKSEDEGCVSMTLPRRPAVGEIPGGAHWHAAPRSQFTWLGRVPLRTCGRR